MWKGLVKNKNTLSHSISLKKYSHIFFDLDNTLWDFEKNSRSAMQETFNFYQLNPKVDFNLFFNVYTQNNHALWDLYRKKQVGKKELIRLRFQDTLTELKIDGINPEEMNACYLNEMPKQKFLNDGAFDLLQYLTTKKYRLYIITNGFKEVQYKKLESSGLLNFFTKIFISEEIKTPKPGREIFEYAIKSANAKKTKSIMIGDDWETDVLGAIHFGIDAIHFDKHDVLVSQKIVKQNHSSGAIYKTGSLLQLLSCF